MAAPHTLTVTSENRKELFYAASELILTLPLATRCALDEYEPDGVLAQRRERLPDLVTLPALRARAILAMGAIVAMLQEFQHLPEAVPAQMMRFAPDGSIVLDDTLPLAHSATRAAEHIAEVAAIPMDDARVVWSTFIHLLAVHWPHETFFGYSVERVGGGVQLRPSTVRREA